MICFALTCGSYRKQWRYARSALRQLSTTKEPSSSAFASRLERHGKASEMTKQSIADCFIELVVAQPDPRRRIDVTTLVKKLEIDRKTFYNHFDNTTDLVIWIFRARLAEKLRDRKFYQAELDYPAEELHDKYTDLPCYARFYGRREESSIKGLSFAPCAACLMSRANTIGGSSASLAISISCVMSSFCSYRSSRQISR